MRGVSLEPSLDAGFHHLGLFGAFDEISVGGNWTNSSVVRYLGADMGDQRKGMIPQVVVLEREVRRDGDRSLVVGPEKEISRYIGTKTVKDWIDRGPPVMR